MNFYYPFQQFCAILTANTYRETAPGFSCPNFALYTDGIWFWQGRKVDHLCYSRSGGAKTDWILEQPLCPVSSQASLWHKDKDGCCWWLTGKRGVAGKRFISCHSDLCHLHRWPVGSESQGGEKATLLFYSCVLFNQFNYGCFPQSLEIYKSYFW